MDYTTLQLAFTETLTDLVRRATAFIPNIVSAVVLVALGSPKQEWLISKLRRSLPACWFIGVGMSFSFTTGHRARAPQWMQRTGLEWVHRLASEPRRLGKRYLWHDAPFGIELLGKSLIEGLKRRRPEKERGASTQRAAQTEEGR